MKRWIFILSSVIYSTFTAGQYFHETLGLQYNLRPEITEGQHLKFSLMTWTYLRYKNTVPNIFDNFAAASRIVFPNSKRKIFSNAEMGIGLHGMIPGRYNNQSTIKEPPMCIRLFDNSGNTNIFIPEVQYLKTWKPKESEETEMRLGLGLRFCITGKEYCHDSISPLGFGASFIWRIRAFSLQVIQSYNNLYSGFRYNSADKADEIYTTAKKITLPDENIDLNMITISFGDSYFKTASAEEKVAYNIYFSARNLSLTKDDAFKEFSLANLDYIAGFRLNYYQLTFNPEYAYRYSIDLDDLSCERQSISLMAGYRFKNLEILTGFSHASYYPFAVDLATLQDSVTLYQERLVICLGYSF